MLIKVVSKTYQIQISEWREIQNILFMIWPILSLHAVAQQNFLIFWVWLRSRSIIHYFVPCWIPCLLFKQIYQVMTCFLCLKRTLFSPASGVIFFPCWPYSTSKLSWTFEVKKFSFGVPKHLHFYVSLFSMS